MGPGFDDPCEQGKPTTLPGRQGLRRQARRRQGLRRHRRALFHGDNCSTVLGDAQDLLISVIERCAGSGCPRLRDPRTTRTLS
jgi:hypothetical protein